MNISLTPQLESMVREKVETGFYNNASEVVREALRLLEARDRQLEWLRAQVAIADAQVERGEVFDLTEDFMQQLGDEAVENARRGKPIRDAVVP